MPNKNKDSLIRTIFTPGPYTLVTWGALAVFGWAAGSLIANSVDWEIKSDVVGGINGVMTSIFSDQDVREQEESLDDTLSVPSAGDGPDPEAMKKYSKLKTVNYFGFDIEHEGDSESISFAKCDAFRDSAYSLLVNRVYDCKADDQEPLLCPERILFYTMDKDLGLVDFNVVNEDYKRAGIPNPRVFDSGKRMLVKDAPQKLLKVKQEQLYKSLSLVVQHLGVR